MALLAYLHRLQRHVLPHALDRSPGPAAAYSRLRAEVRGLEPLHVHLGLRARRCDADLPLQRDPQLGAWGRSAPNPGVPTRSSGRCPHLHPLFNFDEIPQVVGGPYEYGVPGARHAVWSENGAAAHPEAPAEEKEPEEEVRR